VKRFFVTLLLFVFVYGGYAQQKSAYTSNKKGQFYFFWGWNRDAYTKSNITLKGADYDFVLSSVKAHDHPIPFTYHDFLQPDRVTIPQTNMRFGYYIKNNLAITLGVDHMKYVMTQDQDVNMQGYISRPGKYFGLYYGTQKMTEDFLTFEHTDGLNYINSEIEKYFLLYQSKSNQLIISALIGGGVGVLFPKTNVKLMDYKRNDRFHVSGFGLSAKAGIQAVLFKHLMLRAETKGGFIDMPDIILHQKGVQGKGKQSFFFGQANASIGYTCNFK